MGSEIIKNKFFFFFREKGHKEVASSSLLSSDPSVLLTTAGVQQFKPYYIGELNPEKDFGSRRVVSIQKCFRTSDIDKVGDETHLTFFEMLGNFSFGDYWKEEAINWAYEFINKELGVKENRISVSVFKGNKNIPEDQESYKIWNDKIGIPQNRIKKAEMEDNFWGPTGNKGPCGPTTEIYIDGVEVWNIVFNEYFCQGSREDLLSGKVELKKLGQRGVDTGMGLERLSALINGKSDVYQTGSLKNILDLMPENFPSKTKRIITDHLRGIFFLISDSVRPSNKEAGYILRRLIRRVVTLSADLDFRGIFKVIGEEYKDFYKKLDSSIVFSVFYEEKEKYQQTLNHGLKELSKFPKINAKEAFRLYESYGLPFEVIKDAAKKKAIGLKREDFDKEFKKHQEISRSGQEKKFGGHGLLLDTGELKAGNKEDIDKVTRLHTATHLLQQALRDVLGDEVKQMGSDINPERSRFDFSFSRKLVAEEIKKVEAIVNKKIKEDLPVKFEEMSLEKAKKTGALHLFREKYPEKVKVYYIGDSILSAYSKEFCGGPHVKRTNEIGTFKVNKEASVGSGVRRIRVVLN